MNEDTWFDEIVEDSIPDHDSIIPEVPPNPSDFAEKIAIAEKLLSEKGDLVGLCKFCLNTGYPFVFKDGYHYIEYRPDEAKIQLIKCSHGEDSTATFDF